MQSLPLYPLRELVLYENQVSTCLSCIVHSVISQFDCFDIAYRFALISALLLQIILVFQFDCFDVGNHFPLISALLLQINSRKDEKYITHATKYIHQVSNSCPAVAALTWPSANFRPTSPTHSPSPCLFDRSLRIYHDFVSKQWLRISLQVTNRFYRLLQLLRYR